MRLFQRETMKLLKALISDTIASFGEENLTNAEAVKAALPKARDILASEYDAVVSATLRPLVQAQLAKGRPVYSSVQLLIPGLELPNRIAVPSFHNGSGADDDDDSSIVWIVLHKASIAEVRRNVAMREGLIDGAMAELNRIRVVLASALELTSDEDAIVGDVLAGVPA